MPSFIDRVRIRVVGGRGGNGLVTFHREKFLPKGGPSGGDGGHGGSVTLLADQALNTLIPLRYTPRITADAGGRGGSDKKHGRNGSDVVVRVPVGTAVYEVDPVVGPSTGSDRLVADLAVAGASVVVARGGRGGAGNARFVGPTNQEPLLAEAGEEGEARELRLELKLLADVGIVGLPNAGKSSLLASMSAARPRVADYPFTTLEPVLGVVEWERRGLVAVDIPGIIEGAHAGAGLGHDFLRHVERTRALIHLVDGSLPDVAGAVSTVNRELELFSPALANKPQLLVVNKTDIPEVAGRRAAIAARFGSTVLFVSAATREGLDRLIPAVFELVDRAVASVRDEGKPAGEAELPVIRPKPVVEGGGAEPDGDAFRITHRRAIRLANGSDLSSWKARVQFREQLRRMGVEKELQRLGVAPGSTVRIGSTELVWE
jgi:GTP-binding protein